MKRYFNKFSFSVALVAGLTLTSCLKDKGFDESEYQLVTKTEGQEWVSIPFAGRPNGAVNLGVESKAGMQTVSLFPISYDFKDPAPQDITATFTLNNDLVTAYNTAMTTSDPNFTPVEVLPANAYTVPGLTLTIPSGQRVSEAFPIQMNTSLLDPTQKYAVGFTLSSVSKTSASIPKNMRNVIFVFTIKNRFDGIYSIRSRMDHSSDRDPAWVRTPFTYAYPIHLITTGPLTVEWMNEAFGDGFHPLQTPGVSGFGQTRVAFEFDNDNKLVSVSNAYPNPSNGRAFRILTGTDPKTGTPINNRYDPDQKKVYAAFEMTQPGFAPIPIFDTLSFTRVRP